jgi:hypothetical protein
VHKTTRGYASRDGDSTNAGLHATATPAGSTKPRHGPMCHTHAYTLHPARSVLERPISCMLVGHGASCAQGSQRNQSSYTLCINDMGSALFSGYSTRQCTCLTCMHGLHTPHACQILTLHTRVTRHRHPTLCTVHQGTCMLHVSQSDMRIRHKSNNTRHMQAL